ncbi:hypothetical protein N7455_007605 [Penicillium solitum]|uniref:uncharacterized protein n=1 Tax=Penicillium solitum TaxID=60172 RepID=UPI0032C40351|nr:hypothetical protein N7536_012435 [Penicillium majusculum]KAJ5856711.1 hypothetical protein N7455_007605 [Penicillium solitum]
MTESVSFALITGCSSGIGKELALAFAARGVTVFATARRTESLDDLTEVKSLGIEVIEIVTGFVQSSILHRGLHAPEGSVYLPIKGAIADIKYQGNANGMSAGAYAASIVEKLMRLRVSPEIWEGGMARFLRFVVTFLPLRLLNLLLYREFKLDLVKESIGKRTSQS